MKKRNKSAFTLTEMMVVVAILGLLTVIGLPTIDSAYNDAEVRIKDTNVASIESAKEQWALLNNKADGTTVAWEDIETYMGFGIMSLDELDVNGDSITLNDIGTLATYD